MKFAGVIRRGLSTSQLLPPNLASRNAVDSVRAAAASEAHAISPANMAELNRFYARIPKGPAAPEEQGGGLIARYKRKHFSPKGMSLKPLVHIIVAVFGINYFISYQTHLKHHKNVEHH
ncbi:mitochondrial F1-F0 ATP synthase subunit F of fungi-domain-containing protein [Syncephalis plumigaleata]|nr:mitochondrial F1-F0 ATP synthase subunit F of fungi-domain-containing protein [Syncephalis plumigaleata]